VNTRTKRFEVPVAACDVSVYTVPTEQPESDGTFEWDHTTLVLVEVRGGGDCGLGYSYTAAAAGRLARDELAPVIVGRDAMAVPAAWDAMVAAVRNIGRAGLAATAISAVDAALWDLKARLLQVPLVTLLGAVRSEIAVYGSGGFTSYTTDELRAQLAGWVTRGISRVKMKVGRRADDDPARVRAARQAIGDGAQLFVDANGGYSRKQALAMAGLFADLAVCWFEEPVSSDDLAGLRLLRDRTPAGMDVAAGEYGYDPFYFRRMLQAGAVDVLQADLTRCLGVTGFLRAAALCDARSMPLSTHCAPALHLHVACASPRIRHLEYFHDHARIEHMLFDGAGEPAGGVLAPDLSRPGVGLELKRADAARFAA
jgi:L-alanine-DL-glutamate epimerase-like enolase superfamily enzyme